MNPAITKIQNCTRDHAYPRDACWLVSEGWEELTTGKARGRTFQA